MWRWRGPSVAKRSVSTEREIGVEQTRDRFRRRYRHRAWPDELLGDPWHQLHPLRDMQVQGDETDVVRLQAELISYSVKGLILIETFFLRSQHFKKGREKYLLVILDQHGLIDFR